MAAVMRTALIFGLLLLAACLPLAVLPVVVFVLAVALVAVSAAVPFASSNAQPVALLALSLFRAPPSR